MSPVDLTAMSSLGVTEVLCDCSFCAAHESFGLLINCETVTSLRWCMQEDWLMTAVSYIILEITSRETFTFQIF